MKFNKAEQALKIAKNDKLLADTPQVFLWLISHYTLYIIINYASQTLKKVAK